MGPSIKKILGRWGGSEVNQGPLELLAVSLSILPYLVEWWGGAWTLLEHGKELRGV